MLFTESLTGLFMAVFLFIFHSKIGVGIFAIFLLSLTYENWFWGIIQTGFGICFIYLISKANWHQGVTFPLVIFSLGITLGGLFKFSSLLNKEQRKFIDNISSFIGLISRYFIKILPIILIALGFYGFYNYGSKLRYQFSDSLIVLAIFIGALYLSLKQFPSIKKILKKYNIYF